MTNPANPLDNQAAIAQINQAINVIVSELIRPTAQQSVANAQQIESNARAIQATNEGIGELTNTVDAFIRKLDDEGLKVTLITEVADEIGGDVAYLERNVNRHDVSIDALRQDAIADRQAFREQAEADRQAFREALEADRQVSDQRFEESNRRFEAMQETLQRLFLEVRSTNGAVAGLGGRVDDLEQRAS